MVAGQLLILDNIIAKLMGEGMGSITMLELVNSLAIAVILIVSVISIYYSRLRGARIRMIEVQDQVPMSTANHTIVITNYGNKTGVVIGPKLVTAEGGARLSEEDQDGSVIAVSPHDTVIRQVDVDSDVEKDFQYHLEFTDIKGKAIRLPTRTYVGKSGK